MSNIQTIIHYLILCAIYKPHVAEKVPYLLTHYDINDIVVAMLRNVIDNRYWD